MVIYRSQSRAKPNRKGHNMESKTQAEQAKLEQIKAKVLADLEKMESEVNSTGSKPEYTKEQSAIASLLQSGKQDSGFRGKGKNHYYHLKYKGQLAGKITRTKPDSKVTTWKGSHTDKKGDRQTVAISQIQYLQELAIVPK